MSLSPRITALGLCLAGLTLPVFADQVRVEPGIAQSVRGPELETLFANDDGVGRGGTGASGGSINSPWAGTWSMGLPLRIEYDREPDAGGAVFARFRFAEFRSHFIYSSMGRHRFQGRDFDLFSTHEVQKYRSTDQDLEAGYRWKLAETIFLLPVAGVHNTRLSGKRTSRSFGRGIFGQDGKSIFGFVDPAHSFFRAQAVGPTAGLDAEWRAGSFTMTLGARVVAAAGPYAETNVSTLYNPGLGVYFISALYSTSSARLAKNGTVGRLTLRYPLAENVELMGEFLSESYRLSMSDFVSLDALSVESLILAQTAARTEFKLFPFDRDEFVLDRIFYGQGAAVHHRTLVIGVSVRIDLFGVAPAPAPAPRNRPEAEKPPEKKPEPKGPGEPASAEPSAESLKRQFLGAF